MPILAIPPPTPVIVFQVTATAPATAQPPVPSDAVLENVLAEAARLAAQAPEAQSQQADALLDAADAYAAANRTTEAKRLYSTALAAAQKVTASSHFRPIARGQVEVHDDAEALKTAKLSGDSYLERFIPFLIARRDAPADSAIRKGREEDAFQVWYLQTPEGAKSLEAYRNQVRTLMQSSLDNQNTPPARRLSALLEGIALEPEKRQELTARYLPPLVESTRKLTEAEPRASAFLALARVYHRIGDDDAARTALTDAVDASAQIADPQKRIPILRGWLSFNTGSTTLRTSVEPAPTLPPLTIPEPLRERANALAKSTQDSLESNSGEVVAAITQSKSGEAPAETIQRIITAVNYGSATTVYYTPAVLLQVMEKAVEQAKLLPPQRRDVLLRSIAMVQIRAGAPDAAIATMRLSENRGFRVEVLMELPSFAGQALQNPRLAEAAVSEARSFPPGPERYKALRTIVQHMLGKVLGRDLSLRSEIFYEMVALVPPGNPSPEWAGEDSERPGMFLLRLAYLGQHLGEHKAALKLLARAATQALQAQKDSYIYEDVITNIARAQAFSGDYLSAKKTLKAALTNRARNLAAGKSSDVFEQEFGRARSAASFSVNQAAIRDFDGALTTVKTIPVRFAAVRSRALSTIVREMMNARNGKPVEQARAYGG